jgi:Uma2 family endonuclease
MKWQEVCDDPSLKDLPYKIELNEWGKIIMSPASNRHGILQAALVRALVRSRDDGLVISECSVQTSKGVKVADVAWASAEFMDAQGEVTPYVKAPDLCIEILSPGNSPAEMNERKGLYFSKGAREFWTCDEQGKLVFYDCVDILRKSCLFPDITRIDTDYHH